MIKIKNSEVKAAADAAYAKALEHFGSDYAITLMGKKEFKDPRCVKIQEAIRNSSFGCQKANVMKIFSILLGEELDLGDSKIEFTGKTLRDKFSHNEFKGEEELSQIYPGLFVVPVGNENSHDYTLDEVAMFFDGDQCLRKNGSVGNHIGTIIRLATPEEIVQFVSGNPNSWSSLVEFVEE